MRKLFAILALAAVLLLPSVALASPSLGNGDAFIIPVPPAATAGTIGIFGVETGLTAGSTNFLSGYVNVSATWNCSLGGQTTVSKQEHETDSFLANRAGTVYAGMDLYAPLPDRTVFCVGGQITLATDTYTSVYLLDGNTGQTISIPGTFTYP